MERYLDRDYESVKDVLFSFGVLPTYLYIIKTKLCVIGNALRSQWKVVVKCAMWQRNKEDVINLLLQYNVDYVLSKSDIVKQLWLEFKCIVSWTWTLYDFN